MLLRVDILLSFYNLFGISLYKQMTAPNYKKLLKDMEKVLDKIKRLRNIPNLSEEHGNTSEELGNTIDNISVELSPILYI